MRKNILRMLILCTILASIPSLSYAKTRYILPKKSGLSDKMDRRITSIKYGPQAVLDDLSKKVGVMVSYKLMQSGVAYFKNHQWLRNVEVGNQNYALVTTHAIHLPIYVRIFHPIKEH